MQRLGKTLLVRDSTNGTKFDEEREKLNEERQYYFARFCWKYQKYTTPSAKRTWGELFEKKEGMTLQQYQQLREQIKEGRKT